MTSMTDSKDSKILTSNQDAEKILYKMLLIRRVEEEIIARYPKQLMRAPTHLSIGQEAIAVGACYYLKPTDKVFSTHRNHAHYLAHGGDLNKMALELHGKIGGCQDGRGGSMHLGNEHIVSIPIVGSSIPLAVGAAMANKIDGNGNIVICFLGDGAMEEGVFHESMNFASLMKLPIIFVCENNQYSVDTHISKRQPIRSPHAIAQAFDMTSAHFKIEHNVFDIASDFFHFIELCRTNEPLFIIFDTQRSHVHCGIDKEFEIENDPVDRAIKIFLSGDYELNEKNIQSAKHIFEIEKMVNLTFDAAEIAPLPTPDMAKDYIYA